MQDEAFEKWAAIYTRSAADGSEPLWPSEDLIRLLKGSYIPNLSQDYDGKSVVEIGFGNGNNLLFLASLGLKLSGTEVHNDICEMVHDKLRRLGYEADLRPGTNRQIPFPENAFDLLISWNVIHYEDNEADMRAAIAEYARVLKRGGRVVVSTTGPEHKILRESATLGGHLYRIGRDDDFRRGQVFFYFDAPNYARHYFSECFSDVLVGRTGGQLFTESLDYFLVTGVKG